MIKNQFLLLKDQRFAPLFLTQFMGAFHDNLFKNALVVLLLYSVSIQSVYDPKILVTLATAIFIVPFVLFSAIGGQLADKYPKDKVIRVIKIVEVAIALLGAASILSGILWLNFLTLFCLGTQSAFFGPSKYSIVPQHLKEDELIGGNALLNTGTFLAILVGTIAGTTLVNLNGGQVIVSILLILCALSGYVASRSIPHAAEKSPDLKLNFNPFTQSIRSLKNAFSQDKRIVRSILGIAWFYFLGAMFMSQFPNFTKEALGGNEHLLAFFMVLFSVGVAGGGLLNNRLLKGRVEAVYAPISMVGITVFSIDLYFASAAFSPENASSLLGVSAFLSSFAGLRVMFDTAMVALCGGMFVVPLNAIVQHQTNEKNRARILAGSAINNALFIVSSSVISALLISAGFEIRELFLAFAIVNIAVALYICSLLPDYLAKSILQAVFKLLYKVEIHGAENFEKAGDRVVIVGNHVSLLDPPLLAAFLPGRPMFAINSNVANWWWLKPFLSLVDYFPLDPTNPYSMKELIRQVEKDKQVVIFPEGRLTETGALMKVYDGPGMVADKTGATILPVRLDGVQHTPFARLKGKVPLKSFPKITITVLEPRKFDVDPSVKGRQRREAVGRELYDVMEEMMFLTGDRTQTLYQSLLRARYVNGDTSIIAEDIQRKPLKFKQLIRGTALIGRKLKKETKAKENVGVLMPNSIGTLITFFSLQLYGRVPSMLNFSAGEKALLSAIKTAQIKHVVTSRKFIELARLDPVIKTLSAQVDFIYIEDLISCVTMFEKLMVLLMPLGTLHKLQKISPDDPAIILFTSGSEGEPKAVVLSHSNILSNITQLAARVDFNTQDIVFNCLPMFHSFGLTGGTLLPVLSGVRTFLYPSPLHYRIVPELVYSTNATIMFGTDTFLSGYARMANPYDFYRMRYIFAGAEKVKSETKEIYMKKFGVRVLEGYGATETSPALCLNSPMHVKDGSVGRLLPGIECKLEKVEGVDRGGRLFVRGPNVMLGYYRHDNPGTLVPPQKGWYDTGDIVDIDDEGYVSILGRAKRFAKIAGEMVSLSSVEQMVDAVYPDYSHAVIAIPDDKKGEQLILVTTCAAANKESLSSYASKHGISELSVPKVIYKLEEIPLLGTGKTNYAEINDLILSNKLKAA